MGEVWLARHTALDVLCAVKFIYADAASSPELRSRFVLEAKAAAQLRSSHVVQVLDTGVFDGTPYIAMEYLEGEDLGVRLKRVGMLDARQTASIVVQVARALGRAHTASLVHRDLKPANIFLCREDDREIVKVLDFGVAKRVGGGVDGAPDEKTETGALMGTPFYMSPEQAQGTRSIDHRSDLWALAVIAFRCLTGKLPFRSDALGDLLVQIIVAPIPVPSQVAPVPLGFDAWWARAASRDPAHRFQTAKELANSLQMALGLSGTIDAEQPSGSLRVVGLPASGPPQLRHRTTLPLDSSFSLPSSVLLPSTPVPSPLERSPSPVRPPVASFAGTQTPLVTQAPIHALAKNTSLVGILFLAAAVVVLAGAAGAYLLVRPPPLASGLQTVSLPAEPTAPAVLAGTSLPSAEPSSSALPRASVSSASDTPRAAAAPSSTVAPTASARPISTYAAPSKAAPTAKPSFDPGI
jgi:serine/threonine-protein kinase